MTAAEAMDFKQRLREIKGGREESGSEQDSLKAVYRKMSDVEPRQVEQLWHGYITARKFNLLAGYGGVGKDQMMMNIIARLSDGRPLPMQLTGRVMRTLIVAAEDDAHEDIRVRLDANGADVSNIFILDGVSDGKDGLKWVDLKKHAPMIQHVLEVEGIELLYFSPLSAYMPGVTRRDAGDVRDTLGYVQRMIDQTGVTVVGTVHIGKSNSDRRGAMKILDSVEFVNAARNVLAINDIPDEHQPDDVLSDANIGRHKVLEVVKANSTIPGPPISFSRPLDAAVQWHGVAPVGFDESFHGQDSDDTSGTSEAKEFLFEELKGGMKPVTELFNAGEKVGLTHKQLRTAKKHLKITAHKETGVLNGAWFWKLPDGNPYQSQHKTQSGVVDPGSENEVVF